MNDPFRQLERLERELGDLRSARRSRHFDQSVGGSSAPGGGVLALTDDIWQKEFELNLFSALMEHCFTVAGDKIAALSCRLADGDPID